MLDGMVKYFPSGSSRVQVHESFLQSTFSVLHLIFRGQQQERKTVMIGKEELLKWVEGLHDDENVWIDKDELTLETSDGYYIHIGGYAATEDGSCDSRSMELQKESI